MVIVSRNIITACVTIYMSFFDRSSIYGIYDEEACVNIRGRFIIDPDYVQRAMEVLTPGGGVTFLSVLLPTLWAKERK